MGAGAPPVGPQLKPMKRIVFTAHRQAELVEVPDFSGPIGPLEVRGRTVVSLVSPGTEVSGGYLGTKFPYTPGYSCVLEVEETGNEVRDLPAGTLVYGSGGHLERQQMKRQQVAILPEGLAPESAVFARLAGVSMSTLNTTAARPPGQVLVTGLGPVGNLAAQIFAICGFDVTAVDPSEARRESARISGLKDVRASVSEGPAPLEDRIALHLECSGHEQAALDGCRCVRKKGEVVLIGTPWKRRTEIYAQEFLLTVFKRFVVLRSGWEWEIPEQAADFSGNSLMGNYAAALQWLKNGKLRVEGLASVYAPGEAQEAYRALADLSLPTPAVVFNWRTDA